jgi:hypothetical protein
MKHWMFWCQLWMCSLAVPCALAQDTEDEEYMLGDLGVRVDLPDDWSPQSRGWSDWFFKGQMIEDPVQLWVWSTPIQVPAGSSPAAWLPVYGARITAGGGADARYLDGSVATIRGMRVALVDIAYKSVSLKREVHLFGASVAIEGQTLHFATLALPQHAKQARAEHTQLFERLEFRKPAVSFMPGQVMELDGFSFPLPTGWRVPLATEEEAVLSNVQHLPTGNLSSCVLAMRPHPAADPDAMVVCQMSLGGGVLDGYSAERLGDKMAGQVFQKHADTMTFESHELKDRWGWVFTPRDDRGSFAVSLVPNAGGVAAVWVTSSTEGQDLSEVVWEVAEALGHAGPPCASVGEHLQYRLLDRTGSLATLAGLVLLLAALAGVGWGARGLLRPRKNRYELDDDEF